MPDPVRHIETVEPYAERRTYARAELSLPAFLEVNGKRQSVHLLDLSAGGAKLKCPAPVPVGTTVMLDCGIRDCEAVVRWANGEVLGVCFRSLLDPRDVSALVDRSKAMAAWVNSRE